MFHAARNDRVIGKKLLNFTQSTTISSLVHYHITSDPITSSHLFHAVRNHSVMGTKLLHFTQSTAISSLVDYR